MLVRVVQGNGDLPGNFQCLARRYRAVRQPVSQRFAGNEIHRKKMQPLLHAKIVDRNDVGMPEAGSGLRFLQEALQLLRSRAGTALQNFQRDDAI